MHFIEIVQANVLYERKICIASLTDTEMIYIIFSFKKYTVFCIYANDVEQALKPHVSLPKTYPWSHGTEMALKTYESSKITRYGTEQAYKTHAMVQSRLSKHTLWYRAGFQNTRYGTE
jgi:hypothetical protein